MEAGEFPGWMVVLAVPVLAVFFLFAFRRSHPKIAARRIGESGNGVEFELTIENVTEVPVHVGGMVPVWPWRTKLALGPREGPAEPLAAIHLDDWLQPGERWAKSFTVLADPDDDVRSVVLACQIRTKRFMHNSRTRWVRLRLGERRPIPAAHAGR